MKIALLSSYTMKKLAELIGAREFDYDQIMQEIVDKNSKLKTFKPDMTFIVAKQKYGSLVDIAKLFLENITGTLVVFEYIIPSYSPLGINDSKINMPMKDVTRHFNQELRDESANNPRLFTYDFNSFFLRFGERNIISPNLYYSGDILISPNYVQHLADDLMGYIKALSSKNRKCIVLDLDNTLWGGILGEEGFEGIQLGYKPPGNAFLDFQRHLLALHKRGIILAVNSKNNHDDAMKVIKEHPNMMLREKHFASIRINWQDKAANMKEIIKELNIGGDSVVFIDDEPINRELIRKTMPNVLVVDMPKNPAMYVRMLEDMNDFNTLQLTPEDFKKGQMYYEQRKRTETKAQFGSLDDFLKSINIEVTIKKADDFTVPRISQLTMKTNQFNLTTRRYTETDIGELVNSSDYNVYCVGVKDRFGDNGVTGVFIVRVVGRTMFIDTFLLSCRVIGRNIEKTMLAYISSIAKNNGAKTIVGNYIPTNKNMVVGDFYARNGFKKVGDTAFELKDFNKVRTVDYIKVST